MLFLLPPYYRNLGKRIVKSPKIYFSDCGLVCYLTGIKDRDHVMNGPMAGVLFENFCIQEVLKTYSSRGEQPSLFYLRTNNNLEVDLLIEECSDRLIPVECKLSKTPFVKMAAGILRFWKLWPALKNAAGMVVCLSETEIPLAADVSTIPVELFLHRILPPGEDTHKVRKKR